MNKIYIQLCVLHIIYIISVILSIVINNTFYTTKNNNEWYICYLNNKFYYSKTQYPGVFNCTKIN